MCSTTGHELSALDDLGLNDVTTDACLTYLLSFVESCARAVINARLTREDSAIDDQQWWTANAPLLARFLDARAYPRAARIGAAAGAAHGSAHNPHDAYEFGLQRTLDAIAALIGRRSLSRSDQAWSPRAPRRTGTGHLPR
jgi:hypothetical protein